MYQRKPNRVVKNGRLTVSLPEHIVDMLNEIGGKMEAETGVAMSYAQIVCALVHKYNKQDEE